ncbi:hypothetical protein HK102_008910 [Quaeritorhiza haematococci]|nr:hypothetical protein HK102_008910 [Quaeritorhiza haematococci]
MIIATIVLAEKYHDDDSHRTGPWAHVSSIPVDILNAAQRAFLARIDYRLDAEENDFDFAATRCREHVQSARECTWAGDWRSSASRASESPARTSDASQGCRVTSGISPRVGARNVMTAL